MAKFKVGDRVRVLDGSKIEGYEGSWVPDMKEYVGNVYTIARMHPSGSYCLKGIPFIYDERGLERVWNPGKIVITTDGRITTAKLYRHGELTQKAVVTCSPEDTFDFATGAELALDRLIDAVNNPQIQVGDRVRVVNTGECHTRNPYWVAEHIADPIMIARYAYGQGLGCADGIIEHPGTFRVLHVADGQAFIQRMDNCDPSCYLVGLNGLERVENKGGITWKITLN